MMDQGYDHVGRPTNEEVKSKKRKKMLMIGAPVIALVAIIGVIASQGGMSGMMGNSVYSSKQKCTCEKGWQLKNSGTCSRRSRTEKTISAYLVGDVVNGKNQTKPDGKVDIHDWSYINYIITSGKKISKRMGLIIDLNGDGKVNKSDIASYSTSTSGQFVFAKKYVCPKDISQKSNVNGVEKLYSIKYRLFGKTCRRISTITETKKAVCTSSKPKTTSGSNVTPNSGTNGYNTTGSNGYNTSQTPNSESNGYDTTSSNGYNTSQTPTQKKESYKEIQSSTEENNTESSSSTSGIHGYSTSQYTTQYSTY